MTKVREQDHITVRFPFPMREKIAERANANHRSSNAEIVDMVSTCLARPANESTANSAPEKTLRDEIAMAALPSLLTEVYTNSRSKNVLYANVFVIAASAAYEVSDAMLAAREVQHD